MVAFKAPIASALCLAMGMAGATPALAASAEWTVKMTGAAEVPGPGATGTGTAKVTVDDSANTLCYDITTDLADASMAHVHKGPAGAAGGVAVPLQAPVGGATKACAPIDHALAGQILASPKDYYVNIHSKAFPAGAIRAQLGS